MSEEEPIRLTPLQIAPSSERPPRHETVLADPSAEDVAAIATALASERPATALRVVVSARPVLLDAWARLGQVTLGAGDPVAAYAFARTGYHRGLDALRRRGWGGTGLVRWDREGNRGFLRSVHLLLVCAAAIGEVDEAVRCRRFLLELDPDDGIGASGIPENPGQEWTPGPLP